jgi:hemin uptake protein HemP
MSGTLIDELREESPVGAGNDRDAPRPAPVPAKARAQPERVINTRDLLGTGHRIWIEHAAERYLLQITRNGKLILTK